ncbi:hypothetical protein L2E82_35846 [Cichorium intybus]|uniref:Uncharacterized protein n=1 Tax=Cichorium intybus TaxID=13427 RepID=A0ACB9BPW5_CICIN|nr:hypothetical protein L2E82_35846 [Cichorium intybus]
MFQWKVRLERAVLLSGKLWVEKEGIFVAATGQLPMKVVLPLRILKGEGRRINIPYDPVSGGVELRQKIIHDGKAFKPGGVELGKGVTQESAFAGKYTLVLGHMGGSREDVSSFETGGGVLKNIDVAPIHPDW